MRYKKDCLSDDWTVFGEWLEKLNSQRITPGFKEYLLGLTLQRLYLYGVKDIRRKNKQNIKRKVLRKRSLIMEMVFWLRFLKEKKLSPKRIREVTISFWIKTNYCLSHWWIAYQQVSKKWDYYREKEVLVSNEFKEKVLKAIKILENRGYFQRD